MVLMLLLAAAASTAAPPAARPAPAPPRSTACILPGVTFAAPPLVPGGPQKLGTLPPASHYLAVDRRFGPCSEPAVVRTGIGVQPR